MRLSGLAQEASDEMNSAGPRVIRCPRCGGDSIYGPDNPFRPFCGERCRDIDFGTWAAEAYRVGSSPDVPDPESDADDPGR